MCHKLCLLCAAHAEIPAVGRQMLRWHQAVGHIDLVFFLRQNSIFLKIEKSLKRSKIKFDKTMRKHNYDLAEGRSSAEFSLPIVVVTARSQNSHYQSLLSLPDHRILTTNRCCHYQITEFSLSIVVVTTRSQNSHYQSLFVTTRSQNSHYQSLLSLFTTMMGKSFHTLP